MKDGLHPDYKKTVIKCVCGNEIEAGSVVDNITVKVKSLDGVFEVASLVSNKVTFVTDKVVDIISMIIDKIFNKRKDDKNE